MTGQAQDLPLQIIRNDESGVFFGLVIGVEFFVEVIGHFSRFKVEFGYDPVALSFWDTLDSSF